MNSFGDLAISDRFRGRIGLYICSYKDNVCIDDFVGQGNF